MKVRIKPFNKVVKPTSFSKKYNMHKYWGKKPSNVIQEYIDYYTKKGDVVLDPFSGYGVTTIEATLSGRVGIGVDINPISEYILHGVLDKVDLEVLDIEIAKIESSLKKVMDYMYNTICPNCQGKCELVSVIYEDENPIDVKYKCKLCGSSGEKPFSSYDKELIEKVNGLPIRDWFPNVKIFEGWETAKLRKKGFSMYSDLFTHRNLLALSKIFDGIVKVQKSEIRSALLIAFTSMVAQASKMIANFKGKSGGPSWKINTFWIPKNNQELNVWHYFMNRVTKIVNGKKEVMEELPKNSNWSFILHSSKNLKEVVRDNTVDYIFTDPPYGGEGIQYMELSYIWNEWLKFFDSPIDWRSEVAFNPYRKEAMSDSSYEEGLLDVFKEAYRVLKPGAWMSLTFANKDLNVWNAFVRSLRGAGFELKNIVPMKPSAPNITQMLIKEATKTDLIVNVQKSIHLNSGIQQSSLPIFSLYDETKTIVKDVLSVQKTVSLNQVFDRLLIAWMTTNFTSDFKNDAEGKFSKRDVEKLLDGFTRIRRFNDYENKKVENANPRWELI